MAKIANCDSCGKEMKYKTKKPKRCSKCSTKIPYKNKDKKKEKENGGSKSKLEFKVQTWLNELLPEPDYHYIANGFYSWIKSPKGYPLQLDFLVYSKSKTLFAIEIQGPQHYTKAYYQSVKEHEYLLDCDILKKRALAKKGIRFIQLQYKEDMSKEEFAKLIEDKNTLI